jgi:glyceraldehyde-3-phosphate dehydrogenase (ferredoxin)
MTSVGGRNEYRVVFVDAGTGSWRVKSYPIGEVVGPVDLGVLLHLKHYRSWEAPVYSERNVVVLGMGLLAGGKLVGSHRLVLVFRSPLSRGIHVSTMGGAGYQFLGTGVRCLVVEGRAEQPTLLALIGDERGLSKVVVERIAEDELWKVYRGFNGYRGVKALVAYTYEVMKELSELPRSRVAVVGPGALKTHFGGLFAPLYDPRRKQFQPGAFDSASRGGGGSVLARAHGVVAIGFGGSYSVERENPKLADLRLIERLVAEVTGKKYSEAVMTATKKYRFDPKLGTGGTFGVNYIYYRDLVPSFAYNSIYSSKAVRLSLHSKVVEHFWRPFQHEVFESASRPWYSCGEPCPAVCKKVVSGTKVDYEPFNALGPLAGILRFEDARGLVELVDELGLDAIEVGHYVSWILDALDRGLLEPRDVGVDAKPCFNPVLYDVERCSKLNAEIAKKLIEELIEPKHLVARLVAEYGLRGAAKRLSEHMKSRVEAIGTKFEDLLVYAGFGEEGYMTPNLYWAPGLIAPMYLLGRYWTNYSPTFMEPEDMAVSSLHRALAELLIDNAGSCRFHRGWAEKLIGKLYQELWGVKIDTSFAARVYRMIVEYQEKAGAEPAPWESRKTVDMVAAIAAEVGAEEWATKLTRSPDEAGREWWTRFRKKLVEELERLCCGGGSGPHPTR